MTKAAPAAVAAALTESFAPVAIVQTDKARAEIYRDGRIVTYTDSAVEQKPFSAANLNSTTAMDAALKALKFAEMSADGKWVCIGEKLDDHTPLLMAALTSGVMNSYEAEDRFGRQALGNEHALSTMREAFKDAQIKKLVDKGLIDGLDTSNGDSGWVLGRSRNDNHALYQKSSSGDQNNPSDRFNRATVRTFG